MAGRFFDIIRDMEKVATDKEAKMPALPIGNSDWAHVVANDWHADKTQLISGLLDRDATVAIFTRPRRFGKTFAMRMLKTFFEKTETGNAHLFKDTKIWQKPEHRAEQGKYPVIFITFKDAKGGTWKETFELIADVLAEEFLRHEAAFNDKKCPRKWRNDFDAFQSKRATSAMVMRSLGILAAALHAYYKERPVILIDEYDSPINYAATHGFGEKVLQFFRNFLSGAMKDGEHCRLGVITGILRVAKEGVFSGLNNPKVYSVFDETFSDCFGFTEEEVRGMLATFGHPEKFNECKDWYDGYVFGGREIYNPWSLLNYVDDGFKPKAYWLGTSSNDLVTDVLSRLSPEMRDTVANLFEKKEGEATVSPDLGPYGLIQDNEEILWSLLVHTGYLKITAGPDPNGTATIAFPNREVRFVFRDDILARMKRQPSGQFVGRLTRALSSGDAERFRAALEDFLVASASYFDMAKEDFFHGLLLGLLAATNENYEVKSNREGGEGRPDILMEPRPGVTLPGVVLELKSPKVPARATQKRIGALLASAAKKARKQIDEKRYAAEMEAEGLTVLKYGIGFGGKRVELAK